MSKTNAKPESTLNTLKSTGLSQAAREKYEVILSTHARRCVAAQEAKIQARRADALKMFLQRKHLVNKIAACRAAFDDLLGCIGEPGWQYPAWLRDDASLLKHPEIEKGVDRVLQDMKELKPVYTEIKRLQHLWARIPEKVWLATTTEEIVNLLREIGEPAAESDEVEEAQP